MSESYIKSLLSGEFPITPMAAQYLSHVLHPLKEFWLQAQQDYDAWKKKLEVSKCKKEMESRLVVACNNGAGCVLYAIGSCWEAWYEGSCSYRLDDNGLDNAPNGISIWEGHMLIRGSDEYGAELRGEFRNLTEKEWKLLAEGCAPWDEKEWLK